MGLVVTFLVVAFLAATGWASAAPREPVPPFPDVNSGRWYYEAIEWGRQNGCLVGYPSGYFRPDNPATRAELAAALQQCAERLTAASRQDRSIRPKVTLGQLLFNLLVLLLLLLLILGLVWAGRRGIENIGYGLAGRRSSRSPTLRFRRGGKGRLIFSKRWRNLGTGESDFHGETPTAPTHSLASIIGIVLFVVLVLVFLFYYGFMFLFWLFLVEFLIALVIYSVLREHRRRTTISIDDDIEFELRWENYSYTRSFPWRQIGFRDNPRGAQIDPASVFFEHATRGTDDKLVYGTPVKVPAGWLERGFTVRQLRDKLDREHAGQANWTNPIPAGGLGPRQAARIRYKFTLELGDVEVEDDFD